MRGLALGLSAAALAGGVALALGGPSVLLGLRPERHGPWRRPPDQSKAYNAHRLETEYGGRWSKHASTLEPSRYGGPPVRIQDHYMVMPDGSVWRPRVPTHYYSHATGKLMMVKSDQPASPEMT